MTPWTRAALSLCMLCGEIFNEFGHSAHVCGHPEREICVDGAGSPLHDRDHHGVPGLAYQISVGDTLTFSDQVAATIVR